MRLPSYNVLRKLLRRSPWYRPIRQVPQIVALHCSNAESPILLHSQEQYLSTPAPSRASYLGTHHSDHSNTAGGYPGSPSSIRFIEGENQQRKNNGNVALGIDAF